MPRPRREGYGPAAPSRPLPADGPLPVELAPWPVELALGSRTASSTQHAATATKTTTRRIPLTVPGIPGTLGQTRTPVRQPRRPRPARNVLDRAIAHHQRWAIRGFSTLAPG
jgi:hypothetical protein